MSSTAPPPTEVAELDLRDITVRFGGLTALDNVGLTVAPRRVHGVIGPNGAGKTTLFNVACGFVQPDEGSLRVRGDARTKLQPHELAGLGIARTLQGLGLFDHLTVLQNVMVGADRHARSSFLKAVFSTPGSSRDERLLRERAMGILAELGVAEHAGRFPGSLPYPIRKRVALARALVLEPDLLLLDEPASGLSHDEINELGQLIRSLSSTMAVLLVEHHMDLVMSVCDEITVLNFGKVIAHGSPDTIRQDPAVLEAYLGENDEVG